MDNLPSEKIFSHKCIMWQLISKRMGQLTWSWERQLSDRHMKAIPTGYRHSGPCSTSMCETPCNQMGHVNSGAPCIQWMNQFLASVCQTGSENPSWRKSYSPSRIYDHQAWGNIIRTSRIFRGLPTSAFSWEDIVNRRMFEWKTKDQWVNARVWRYDSDSIHCSEMQRYILLGFASGAQLIVREKPTGVCIRLNKLNIPSPLHMQNIYSVIVDSFNRLV